MNTNTALKLRTCPDCNAYLSIYNKGDRCWPCQEKQTLEVLTKPFKAKAKKIRYHGPYIPVRGACSCCGRIMTLKGSKFGKLCMSCQKRLRGFVPGGPGAEEALQKAKRESGGFQRAEYRRRG